MTNATVENPNQWSAPDRFAVSHEGMREIHGSRPPWQLVKELIQNVFDEAPTAALCAVTIAPAAESPAFTYLKVADDGPGFADPRDSWTLLKPTPKRLDPAKRGRFNLGEKELISVALDATVTTVGWTIEFPRLGSRCVHPNERERGTIITAILPWDGSQREELIDQLLRFRPTDCQLTVNGQEVPQRQPVKVREAILPTVLQDGPGLPLRSTRRKTAIHLLPPLNPEQSWLYEMGIPIQPLDCPWDIDILQKVPMPPNRDTVSASYLQDIYAEVLNAAADLMPPEAFGESWLDTAIEDSRVETESVKQLVAGRYGAKPIISGPDRDANLRAAEAGHNVISPNSLSRKERERFRQDAQVPTAHQLYGRGEYFVPDVSPQLPQSHRSAATAGFADWVRRLAAYCGLNASVEFYANPKARILADCSAATNNPTLRFNAGQLPAEFFSAPYNRPEQLALIIHELGHALADKPMEHGPAWGEAVAQAGGRIAAALQREIPEEPWQ